MRYVPNLIPDSSKILPDYFKGDIYKPTRKNPALNILMWILGIFFFIGALVFIKHPLMFLVFGLLGFILIPPGHKFLEKKLRFRLTPKIKAITASTLFLGAMPLSSHYQEIDRQEAYQQKLLDDKAAQEKAVAAQKEQLRKDSLSYYLQQSSQSVKNNQIPQASTLLTSAIAFASTEADKDLIEKGKIEIAASKALDLVKAGKYQVAISEITNLLNTDPSNSRLLYNRAVCYSKTGKIQEAVNDLKPLLQSSNTEAEKLHDKINPIRKRVAYYVTRCWDGSTSSSKGSGACSHHGGVKNWNEPVYEEYRKYE